MDKDVKAILIGFTPVVFQQLFFSDKMIDISTYWSTTILTLSILIVIYYLYFRLKIRLSKLYELHNKSGDRFSTVINVNAEQYKKDRSEIIKLLEKPGRTIDLRESEALNIFDDKDQKELKKLEEEVKNLFKDF